MAQPDRVRIVLAHHFSRDGEQLLPGDEIEVPHHEAQQLIGAGYVADVDPTDSAAVAKALAPVESKPALAKPTSNKAAGQASG
ncbi:hypothetical protein [Streptomyces sp. FH025]|uniref:hypothetical protein n=1 Tax=Streptomyces sp. FH025 TaxID=2815937 RepID=UPI001A9D3A20|nr:hypothetical protein [Streptomyces sp. FH025]MBO1413223.1 hypothetical protein [Streptomyces sp. FH025]